MSPAKRALLAQLRRQAQAAAVIPPRPEHAPVPVSLAQQRLWFLDQLEPGNPFYNVAVATRITGTLDAHGIAEAIRAVIARHESLRTVFRPADGLPEQIVLPAIDWDLPVDSLLQVSPADRDCRLRELMEAEALRPFDLARGPLVRGRLVQLSCTEHVLLLTLHHIICDGWSLAVLRAEISEQLAARLAGRPPQLAPLVVQYGDYALWQRATATRDAAHHLDYWRTQLAGMPDSLELPLDFARPEVQSYRGSTVRWTIDRLRAEQLRRVAAEENCTLCMLLLAAFQIVLARFSGQDDLCVGTPIANRQRPELEPLIGFFVNTLVIRGRIEGNPTFREFLAETRATMLAAYAHQDLPFEQLVDALQPRRDLSRNPLVQVMFVLQNIPVRSREIPGLQVTETSFDHAPVANFDVTLNVDEHADRFDLSLVFNTDLFQPATAERLLSAYVTLLDSILADRAATVASLSMLSATERQRALESCNDTTAPMLTDKPIHDLIVEQARRTPQAVAVASDEESLTYADLDRRSNRLARHLIELGARADTPIGICLERSPGYIVALLAILKSGACYLPIDPHYPRARRAAMIADAQLELLISDRGTEASLPAGDYRIIRLDADEASIARWDDAPLPGRAHARSLAYVLYTSGSTGTPKAVEVEHRGLVNHAQALIDYYGLQPGDRLLQYLSLSFDAAAEEIYPALVSGATLQLHPAPAELSGRVLLDWSRERGVNVLHLPVVVWSSLVEEVCLTGGASAGHLKAVLAGGDSVASEQLRRWQAAVGPEVRFLFAYGVTEATITSTIFDENAPSTRSASRSLPIGRPIANTRLYVLDAARQPVPTGVPGELYIGGLGVARGYRNAADATRDRFLPDPYCPTAAARMYRTGDRVRLLNDGNLEFLGRVDRQVKVRGYRVEPAEIEAALQLHEQVREVVVVAHGAQEAKRLVAYVGCAAQSLPTARELHEFLSARLPMHMLPAAIEVLDRLPRLDCAKVDIAALPAPEWRRLSGDAETVAVQPGIEQTLARIWAEVLGVAVVGANDNFFDLGGDSIRTIQVVARARAAGLTITPKQLFQHQTVAALAQVATAAPALVAEQGPVTGAVTLLPIQHEFLRLAGDAVHHHNQALLLTVSSDVSVAVIERMLHVLSNYHDALRSRFARAPEGGWTQTILPPGDAPVVAVVNLRACEDSELSCAITAHATMAQQSLDIEHGPLLQAVYFDCGSARPARLLLAIHHLAMDAVSWRILLGDIDLVCRQLQTGVEPCLPPKTTSIVEWGRRMQALADSEAIRAGLPAWLATAKGMQPLRCDHTGQVNRVGTASKVVRVLDAQTTARLLGEAQQSYRARTPELLCAALAPVLLEFSGQRSTCINLEGHGRTPLWDDVDLSRTVGWFTSLYPLALSAPRGGTGELVRDVKQQLRQIDHGGIGYGLLRWLSGDAEVRGQLAALPPVEICCNYLGQLDHSLPEDALFGLGTESVGPTVSADFMRPHLWEIISYVRDGELHIEWHYSRAHHRDETILRLADRYRAELAQLVEGSDSAAAQAVAPVDFPLADMDQADVDALAKLLAGE